MFFQTFIPAPVLGGTSANIRLLKKEKRSLKTGLGVRPKKVEGSFQGILHSLVAFAAL